MWMDDMVPSSLFAALTICRKRRRERVDRLKGGESLDYMFDVSNRFDPDAVALRTCDSVDSFWWDTCLATLHETFTFFTRNVPRWYPSR